MVEKMALDPKKKQQKHRQIRQSAESDSLFVCVFVAQKQLATYQKSSSIIS